MIFLDIESHDYVMKIVPTIYQKLDGLTVHSYQYTYAYKVKLLFNSYNSQLYIPIYKTYYIYFKYLKIVKYNFSVFGILAIKNMLFPLF